MYLMSGYLISGCPMHDFVAFLLPALPSPTTLARTDLSSLVLFSIRVRIGQPKLSKDPQSKPTSCPGNSGASSSVCETQHRP